MKKYLFVLTLLLMVSLMMSCGSSTAADFSAEFFAQNHNIAAGAELRKVAMELRPMHAGSTEQVVIFHITLRNTTNEPRVYRVLAVIEGAEGLPAAGIGMIPHDDQGVLKVQPGQEFTDRVAVSYDRIPNNFLLTVTVEN
ncbi:MAG: hypothetical protein FWC36_03975 [Spirochaetes bacterium]|nr:hypothetical protein [Spirochaetota bacterium]